MAAQLPLAHLEFLHECTRIADIALDVARRSGLGAEFCRTFSDFKQLHVVPRIAEAASGFQLDQESPALLRVTARAGGQPQFIRVPAGAVRDTLWKLLRVLGTKQPLALAQFDGFKGGETPDVVFRKGRLAAVIAYLEAQLRPDLRDAASAFKCCFAVTKTHVRCKPHGAIRTNYQSTIRS